MLLEMILRDVPIAIRPDGQGVVASPIHDDDIYTQTPRLLEAASVPATIVNWGGDDAVPVAELAEYIASCVGRSANVVESGEGIHHYWLDATKRTHLAGKCAVSWKAGIDQMIAARNSEVTKA
jgi:nucleoside-diphosphate-sugar epimerase